LKNYSRIFKDAGKYSRTTRCFSRIKDKTGFDSKFTDNSWRSRTFGNLNIHLERMCISYGFYCRCRFCRRCMGHQPIVCSRPV